MNHFLIVGDKIQCKDYRDLRLWALKLSADGYEIGVIGHKDIFNNVLTVLGLPQEGSEDE